MARPITIKIHDKESIEINYFFVQFNFSIYSRHFYYRCKAGSVSVSELKPNPNNYNQPSDEFTNEEFGLDFYKGPDLDFADETEFHSENLDEHILMAGFIARKFFL